MTLLWTDAQVPEIGPLEQVLIHEWYDGPLIMSCKGPTGQLYLATMWHARTDPDKGGFLWEEWAFFPMSPERYEAIQCPAQMDMRTAYLKVEGGKVFIVRYTAGEIAGTWVEAGDLPNSSLPVPMADLPEWLDV